MEQSAKDGPGPPPGPWSPDRSALSVLESGCGIVDRSHRGRLILHGSDAAALLQGQLSNDVEALESGQGCEAAMLSPKGKLLGIVRVLALGDDRYSLDTDRISLQELFDRIRRSGVGHRAELEKATLETAQLSLVGPKAARISGATDLLDEHAHREALFGGTRVRLVATWEGVDLFLPAGSLDGVMTALLAAGATPGDEAAAECLRVEAGIPRFGIDIDSSVIPQEADLNHRLVSFTKGCYVGQETVARLFYRGSPNRALRGLLVDSTVQPGSAVTLDGREVGRVGSVSAPRDDSVTALALLRLEAEPGSAVRVGDSDAEVVELPFALPDSPSGAA